MGWHAEAQSGRGVLGELRGESARVRRLSRTGRAQLADSVGTPWQVGNGCRHAVKEVDMRPGTSWQFIALITAGYFAGIAAKFVSGNLNWVLIVYFINVVCIAANCLVYFRNRRLDAQRSTEVVMEEESFVVVA